MTSFTFFGESDHMSMATSAYFSLIGLLCLLFQSLPAAETATPFDTNARVPWTTSQVIGAPEPPAPCSTVRLFSRLSFDSPVDLQLAPDRRTWFMVTRDGQIFTFPNRDEVSETNLLIDLSTKKLPGAQQRNAYSMTFHPQFSDNGFMYVCYRDARPLPGHSYVVRYKLTTNANASPHIEPNSEFHIIRWESGVDHFGGCLQFGPDGYLYIPVGDGSGYGDHHLSGQDLSDFQASILRIDVNKPILGQAYRVPADNPFIGFAGAKPEIWAYGLRNIWKMSFDSVTGELWGCDVGQDLWDSVMRIERGDNFGWSVFEGSHSFRPERKIGPTPIRKPVVDHGHHEARSLTGGFVYRGKALPDLVGAYLYGDFDTGKIWGVRADKNGTATWQKELVDTPLKIVAFAQDENGELIIVHFGGEIHRLIATDPQVYKDAAKHVFPKRLSETGLFSDTARHQMAPGVIPYSVNSPLWSDNAHKDRFMAIPGEGQINHQKKTGWDFPNGTVLVKTFALDLIEGDSTSRKRLETRLLHLEQDHWRGYTYVWNDVQNDATLLEDAKGADRTFAIKEKDGSSRQQTWHFPGRAECTLCHTMPLNFVLGPSTAQMNRLHNYGNGVVKNQLSVFEKIGLLEKKLPKDGPALLAKLAEPHDTTAKLDERARAYLHANCAHCHVKMGGGNAFFYLPHDLPLADTNSINLDPQHGHLGLMGAKIIVPGDPTHSLILARMMHLGPERMPRIASSVLDHDGIALIQAWISSLNQK